MNPEPKPPVEYPEFEALKRGALAVGRALLVIVVGLVKLGFEMPFGFIPRKRKAEDDAPPKG